MKTESRIRPNGSPQAANAQAQLQPLAAKTPQHKAAYAALQELDDYADELNFIHTLIIDVSAGWAQAIPSEEEFDRLVVGFLHTTRGLARKLERITGQLRASL